MYGLYSMTVFLWLGAAWLAVASEVAGRHILLFAWARLVREAVADLLPFSQLGGLVAGSRTLIGRGVPRQIVYASMIADMTTEMASQLLFTLFGLATATFTLLGVHAGALRAAALGATAALTLIMVAFMLGQRPMIGLAGRLARRILPAAALAIETVHAELDRAYSRRWRLLLSFLFNLAGWIASGAGAWLLLRLIGASLPLITVLAIESLIFTVRSVAFMVPGALGFQEAAYIIVGPLFGLPAESAIAVSIIKRARDILIGVPTLLAWQGFAVCSAFVRQKNDATL